VVFQGLAGDGEGGIAFHARALGLTGGIVGFCMSILCGIREMERIVATAFSCPFTTFPHAAVSQITCGALPRFFTTLASFAQGQARLHERSKREGACSSGLS
jgi:hypothetical protein